MPAAWDRHRRSAIDQQLSVVARMTHLDAVILSHADTDHYNALPELLDRFSVGTVYVSPVMFKQPNLALKMLRDSIERSGTKLDRIYAGDRLHAADGVTIDVLHPPPEGVPGTDNANCLVLGVEFCDRRIPLTGDLEPPGMQMVMNEFPFRCDVLLAPHHGSAIATRLVSASGARRDMSSLAARSTTASRPRGVRIGRRKSVEHCRLRSHYCDDRSHQARCRLLPHAGKS